MLICSRLRSCRAERLPFIPLHIMKVIFGSDHSGFKLKSVIMADLKEKGYQVEDCGAFSDVASDYPDYTRKVARELLNDKSALGILICGTGIGCSIAANRIPGIRAGLCTSAYEARMSREHNNANILCLGERVLGEQLALEIVDTWLNARFSREERHVRRLQKVEEIPESFRENHRAQE